MGVMVAVDNEGLGVLSTPSLIIALACSSLVVLVVVVMFCTGKRRKEDGVTGRNGDSEQHHNGTRISIPEVQRQESSESFIAPEFMETSIGSRQSTMTELPLSSTSITIQEIEEKKSGIDDGTGSDDESEFELDDEGYRVRKVQSSDNDGKKDNFFSSDEDEEEDEEDRRKKLHMKSLRGINIRDRNDENIHSSTIEDVQEVIRSMSTLGTPMLASSRSRSSTRRENSDSFVLSPVNGFGDEDAFMASTPFSTNNKGIKPITFDDSMFDDPFASVNVTKVTASPTILKGDDHARNLFDDDGADDPFSNQASFIVDEQPTKTDVNNIDVSTLTPLCIQLPKVKLTVKLLSRTRDYLRREKIKLWLLPYTDVNGNGSIPSSLIQEVATATQKDEQHAEAAVEHLRVLTYNKKVAMLQAQSR
eukprot:m.5924 g.5924  ORF g.5924 m.5924 type:complete len:419 (+) comp2512_c0_seq1:26-1282(+)